jgi:Viral BACON domain/Domain of unknown function (DUF5666)
MLSAMLTVACGGSTTVTEVTGPDPVRCQTSVSGAPASVPAAGNRLTLTVTAPRECTWSAASEASWVQVSPATGQGEGSVTLTVSANPEGRSRTGAVVVNGNRLSVAQEAAPCRYEVSPPSIRLSHDGGRGTFRVTATAACEWQAGTNDGWVRILNSSGSSNGTVEVEAAPNVARVPRVATLSIAGQTVTLTQDSEPSPTPTPAPPGPLPAPNCTASIDPPDRGFSASADNGSFRITAPNGCRWNASSNANWVEITSGATAIGADTVGYRVAANTSTSARTAAITASGQTHVIRQAGAPQPPPPQPPPDNEGQKVDFSGRALFVDGSCPNLTFLVDFRHRVFTTNDTNFKGNCRNLESGTRVSVDGRLQPDGRVRATKVEIDDDDD